MMIRLKSIATFLLFCMASACLFAQSGPELPTLMGRIVDQANLLDAAIESELDEQLAAHEAQTSNQIVVVTVDSLDGYADADYALRLGREWGIGTEQKSNGVILLVAPNERKVRIEVGYGLEGALPDGLAGQIIRQSILPQFKASDYPGGIRSGVNAILQAVVGEYKAEPANSSRSSSRSKKSFDFIPLFFIGMIAIPAILRKRGLFRVANAAFPGGFGGLAASLVSGNVVIGILVGITVFAAIYLLSRNTGGPGGGHGHQGRGGHIGGGMGGGSGMGGGGFSGGGGGGFGGGGASGSW